MNDYQPERSSPRPPPAPPIASERIEFENKKFYFDLKENARGRVITIVEDVGGRRDRIMLPAGLAAEFVEALQRLLDFESKL